MERLTFKNGDDIWCVDDDNCYEEQSEHYCGPAIDRLAEYEDTGLTPEEVKDMAENAETRLLTWFESRYGFPVGDLMGLLEAKQEGRVVVLPCKVGDTVYEVQQIRKRVQPLEIISVYIGRMGGLFFNWELKDGVGVYQNVKGFGLSQIGKTVFLTREEAEAALVKENERSTT